MTSDLSQQHAEAPTSGLIPIEASWTELAASVFTYSHDGIIVTDPRGRIREINRAFTMVTGYSRGEVVGKNPRFLQSGQHGIGFYAELWKELLDKGVWRGEMVNRRKDGRIATELLTISAVHTEEGKLSAYVGIFSDITELKEKQRQLEKLAHFDVLTGLPNRVLLMDRMRQMLAWAERHHRQVAVCYLDLDGFKEINDRHGHHMGDKVLVEVARRLRSKVRNGDTVARLGGDEFVLLLAEPGTAEEVRATLGRIIKNLAKPIDGNLSIVISASIGVAIFPADHGDPDTLLQHADQAMYRDKKAGRVTDRGFDSHCENPAQARQDLLTEAGMALARDEFGVYYQPKLGLKEQKITGFEALLRWQHPSHGLLMPEQFQTVLDNPEFAARIDRWVLREVLKQMALWLATGFRAAVSVNVSTHLLRVSELPGFVADLLNEYPCVRPGDFELEIVESVLLGDLADMGKQIEACGKQGIGFAIDDFGTGYSSLSYLNGLPVGVLKIDRAVVARMVDHPDDHAIVTGIVTLAKAFNRRVVAEGVETPAHVRLLSQLDCDMVQGPCIAAPMTASQVRLWVEHFVFDDTWLPGLPSQPDATAAACIVGIS